MGTSPIHHNQEPNTHRSMIDSDCDAVVTRFHSGGVMVVGIVMRFGIAAEFGFTAGLGFVFDFGLDFGLDFDFGTVDGFDWRGSFGFDRPLGVNFCFELGGGSCRGSSLTSLHDSIERGDNLTVLDQNGTITVESETRRFMRPFSLIECHG